jgi:hypothetical protein
MADARHHHAVQVVLVPMPVGGSPQPLKCSKYPVQHREAWRPRTKAPSKAEALRKLLDAINRNDETAREMLTPRPDLLKAWLKAA